MKAAWAIAMGLLLVFSQAASLAVPLPTPLTSAKSCHCCNCGGSGCCVQESDPEPAQPAVPVSAPSQQTLQETLLSIYSQVATDLPLTACHADFPPLWCPSRASAVALFEKNCAFLI